MHVKVVVCQICDIFLGHRVDKILCVALFQFACCNVKSRYTIVTYMPIGSRTCNGFSFYCYIWLFCIFRCVIISLWLSLVNTQSIDHISPQHLGAYNLRLKYFSHDSQLVFQCKLITHAGGIADAWVELSVTSVTLSVYGSVSAV